MNGFRTSLRIKSDYFPTQNDQQSFVMETRCFRKNWIAWYWDELRASKGYIW